MKKILIAIEDDFLSGIYNDLFSEKGFNILVVKNKEEIFSNVLENSPDIVLLDVVFAEENDFELLKKIKSNDLTKKIPIVLFSKIKESGYRKKAIDFELKDFVISSSSSPIDILAKLKIHLSVEKSYRLPIDAKSETIKDIAKDLGYEDLLCRKCLSPLKLYLIRDLSKGHNYFKVSFICTNC